MKCWIKRIVCLLCAALLTLVPAGCDQAPADPAPGLDPGGLTLDVLETGESDCLLLRLDELVILIDTADEDDADVIRSCLDGYGITKIDWLVFTHYDNDHVGAAPFVLKNYRVSHVIGPAYRRESKRMTALQSALDDAGLTLEKTTVELTLTGESGRGSVLINPTTLIHDPTDESDENNQSLILYVTYDGHGMLLLGDALKDRTAEWSEMHGDLTADFVKLPHHGDYNKAMTALLANCGAKYAVSCVGAAADVEDKLSALCATLDMTHYLTPNGTVRVTVKNGELTVTQP